MSCVYRRSHPTAVDDEAPAQDVYLQSPDRIYGISPNAQVHERTLRTLPTIGVNVVYEKPLRNTIH